jgi:hypothetical protein
MTRAAGVGHQDDDGSRALERLGDQAVDFGEQTAFSITGERHEFNEGA